MSGRPTWQHFSWDHISMQTSFPHLAAPIHVGPFTLKNRMAVAPHGPFYADKGVLTQRYVDYEIEKAKGGAGLVIMSFGVANHKGPDVATSMFGGMVATWDKRNIPYFRVIVAGIHEHGARVFFQFGESAFRSKLAVSALPHLGNGLDWTPEMSKQDIADLMDSYARCAEVIAEAGLDGIEMHGHGDFFSDFFSLAINRREDEYGGCRENRLRFFLEAASVIRGVIGTERVLGARLSVYDLLPGSLPLEEGVEVARLLAASGWIDYLNIDTSIEPQLLEHIIPPMYVEQGYEVYAAEAVKRVVRELPIFTAGRIVDPQFAEDIIAAGRADVVTMARALIADPEWPNKVLEGRTADIRPCLGDNQECIGRAILGLPMGCTVNPAAGNEREWGIGTLQPAAEKRRVTVVGGGPAGMEAARIAALRGHDVHLIERSGELGGQVLLARQLPGRADIGKFLPWQERQLGNLPVRISLGMEATVDSVVADAPDVVIVATGSDWDKSGLAALSYLPIAGTTQANVLSVTDVMAGAEIGDAVIVLDLTGFVQAPGIAEMLATAGKSVELLTPYPRVGSTTLEFTYQRPFIMQRLATAGVVTRVDTSICSIEGMRVELMDSTTGQISVRDGIDSVIIVGGRIPQQGLAKALTGKGIECHSIGDCAEPATIGRAFGDAWQICRAL
ncbi:FAD-dependent oxidoreductase [Sphingobium sp. DEHP117]|uniref:oxidoreductase n=1 Tax=Sphingobium sp. DEHP117 TaxID=2993436 RepID=UPI0027D53221|nr:FAD-dependent oxidoreductase [Sphingobium sp. DEHP117]MDQ4421547.1 FAD-dependent oxidoreductase [Sphingobium sp. DEHP117]